MAFRCLHNPKVEHYLSQLMLQSGMISKAINSLLEAMEAEVNGRPDGMARSRAVDMVFRITGAYEEELTKG